jgi:hypothetical protein
MSAAPRTWLFALIPATIAFKLWLSAVFPMTGDEAYFIHWGIEPALGYYDHPPMVGWWLALLVRLSAEPWVLRLPAVLLPAVMSLALYAWLRPRDESRAALAAIALLLVPLHVWNVFITTDAPLVLFSFFSGMAFWRAVSSQDVRWYLAAGALLGLAALSKYFAAILGLAYLVHVLFSPRGQRDWRGLMISYAAALPFIAINLYWNYENCWANLMFNLYNRHDDAGLSWRLPLLYALAVAYLLAPPALVALARNRTWRSRLAGDPGLRLLVVLGGFPFLLFGVLSLVRQVGLHWLLSFVPFFFAACALLLERAQLKRTAQYAGALALVHVLAIATAGLMPLERWQGTRLYDGIVFHFRIHDVLKELQSHEPQFALAADGYSAASTLSYYRGRYVFVFGEASSHARHDDLVTDFRALTGRDIAILRKSPPREADYAPYFRTVEYRSFRLNGADFHVVLGRGFDYGRYRDEVLALVRDRYYRMPSYLPRGHCDFCARYFESACPVR